MQRVKDVENRRQFLRKAIFSDFGCTVSGIQKFNANFTCTWNLCARSQFENVQPKAALSLLPLLAVCYSSNDHSLYRRVSSTNQKLPYNRASNNEDEPGNSCKSAHLSFVLCQSKLEIQVRAQYICAQVCPRVWVTFLLPLVAHR